MYTEKQVFELAAKQPTRYIKVADLKWMFEHSPEPDITRVAKADLKAPIIVTKLDDGKYVTLDGLHRVKKAINEGVAVLPMKLIESFEKEARLSSPLERAKMREYHNKNKAQLARKAKRRKREQSSGIKRKTARIGSAAGGYSFVPMAISPSGGGMVHKSMTPVVYKPLGLGFPSSHIKVGGQEMYFASSAKIDQDTLRSGSFVKDNIHAALILAVNWSPDDLENYDDHFELPLYLGFIDKNTEPADHPIFLYKVEDAKTEEALTPGVHVLTDKAKLVQIAEYPSWKAILSSEESLSLV